MHIHMRMCVCVCAFYGTVSTGEPKGAGAGLGATLFRIKGPQLSVGLLSVGSLCPESPSRGSVWQCLGLGPCSVAALASWWAWGPGQARGTLDPGFTLRPHGPPLTL